MEQIYKRNRIFGKEELASIGGVVFVEGRRIESGNIYRAVTEQLEGHFVCTRTGVLYPKYLFN